MKIKSLSFLLEGVFLGHLVVGVDEVGDFALLDGVVFGGLVDVLGKLGREGCLRVGC